ncbi:MAG: Purine nucleoside phosphorylase 1 [Planctomycetota bacterium]|jgi:purine-nucleoside phosphorylase
MMPAGAAANSIAAAESFRRLAGLPQHWTPAAAVVLGSGLGGTATRLLDNATHRTHLASGFPVVEAAQLPGMAPSRVAGHSGQFAAGFMDGVPILFQLGRIHAYEGHSFHAVTASVRFFAALGAPILVLTNAAGGIHSDFRPGDFMLIRDHLRMPANISVTCSGLTNASIQHRGLWTPELLNTALTIPGDLHLHSGIYAMMPGPAYETPAEVRMLRALGADAVGMSTVPEALQAAALGIRVLGISCITNIAAGLQNHPLSHAEVTETGNRVEAAFAAWIRRVLLTITAGQHNTIGISQEHSPTDADG